MKSAAAELIARKGPKGATSAEIARNVLKAGKVTEALAEPLVSALLGGDCRFQRLRNGAWAASVPQAAGTPIASAVFTVVDVETTGMAPVHRIIEIGAARVENLAVGRTYETLVDAGVHIPSEITSLTGITREMLDGAPGPAEALSGLLDFMSGSVFAAHNAPFDRSFVFREAREYCGRMPDNPVLCTRLLARRAVPGKESYSLDAMARAVGHEIGRRHRALDDALAAARLLISCCQRLMELGVSTVEELLFVQKKAGFDRMFKSTRKLP